MTSHRSQKLQLRLKLEKPTSELVETPPKLVGRPRQTKGTKSMGSYWRSGKEQKQFAELGNMPL